MNNAYHLCYIIGCPPDHVHNGPFTTIILVVIFSSIIIIILLLIILSFVLYFVCKPGSTYNSDNIKPTANTTKKISHIIVSKL